MKANTYKQDDGTPKTVGRHLLILCLKVETEGATITSSGSLIHAANTKPHRFSRNLFRCNLRQCPRKFEKRRSEGILQTEGHSGLFTLKRQRLDLLGASGARRSEN